MLADFFIDLDGRPASRRVRVARVMVLGGILLALIGIAVWGVMEGMREDGWQQWGVVVRESGVDVVRDSGHEDRPYVFHVTYEYDVGGKMVVSHGFRRDYSGSEDAAEAYGLVRRYPAGKGLSCWVNPMNASESVLEKERPWLALGFGAGMVGVLAFMVPWYFVPEWRGVRREKSEKTERLAATAVALGGLAWLVGMYGVGLVQTVWAATWPEVPCVVRDAAVASHDVHGEHPLTLYRADVLYEYEVGGEKYWSNRLNFTEMAAPYWPYGKRRTVRAYAVGTRTMSRVRPGEPSEAVLTVGVRPAMLGAVLPVGLMVVGMAGVWKTKAIGLAGPRVARWAWAVVLMACAGVLWMVGSGAVEDWRAGEAAGVEMAVTVALGLVMVLVMGKYWRVVNG